MGDRKEDGELILVVDDEPLVREFVSRRLGSSGYNCIVADSGEEALKHLEENKFSLILLDINMPGKSGIDVLREIQLHNTDTMVIMVSALSDIKVAVEAVRMGAYDYLVKPIDMDMLLLSVDRALKKRRLLIENKEYQVNLEAKVRKQTQQIRDAFLNAIKSLANALEAKDKYTHGHSERVTEIAVAIAREMNLPEEKVEKIRLAGLLHDIGKIGVNENVLNKPGKLTEEEFNQVKLHCRIGERILLPIINDEEITDIVSHHHERYDGSGYPDGLMDGQISLNALIMVVADAYDAMTSDRPYRKALDPEVAREELVKGKCKQFDPVVVDALLRILDKGIKL